MKDSAFKTVRKIGFKSLSEVNDYINDKDQHLTDDQFNYQFRKYRLRFNLLIAGAAQMRCMVILGMVEQQQEERL